MNGPLIIQIIFYLPSIIILEKVGINISFKVSAATNILSVWISYFFVKSGADLSWVLIPTFISALTNTLL